MQMKKQSLASSFRSRFYPLLCVTWLALLAPTQAAPLPPTHIDDFTGHPRLIVISDIGNEPDDQMSLVRLLLYSNELDIKALIASTSTWQKSVTHPETMQALTHAYGAVRPNLLLHAKGWPTAEYLSSRVFAGQPGYGLAATGPEKMSPGAEAIIREVDSDDSRPLWICLWGGPNTLAEALLHVRATRKADDIERFISKLRISSISDQDDSGPWLRQEFPDLFYIVQPSTQTSGEYYYATWTGISGDVYYRNGAGADSSTVTNEWLDAHIRSKGPLGKMYPRFAFIMEGDTPSFLGLIDNGLNAYRRPDWGGWGGRYIYRQPYGETHPSGRREAISSPASPRRTPSSASTARHTPPIRPPSGAGAPHFKTTSPHAWTGPSQTIVALITIQSLK